MDEIEKLMNDIIAGIFWSGVVCFLFFFVLVVGWSFYAAWAFMLGF